jgi:hypothetical protein
MVTIVISLYGNAVISLLIVAFSSDIELDYTDNLVFVQYYYKIYTIYEKTLYQGAIKRKAGSAIKNFLKFINTLKQKNNW